MTKQTARIAGSRGATCRTTAGNPCNGQPLRGSDPPVCARHMPNPKGRANAAVRAEIQAWRLDDATADPGQTLLRLLTQAANRAALYGMLLEQQYAAAEHGGGDSDLPAGIKVLIGHRWAMSKDGPFPVAEAIRGLVELESQERDRAARYAKLALDAGIAERLVQLEQDKVNLFVGALRAILTRLKIDPRSPEVVEIVTSEIRALEGAA